MTRTASSRTITLAIAVVLAGLAGTRPAAAQATGERWHIVLAPYVWASSLDGTTTLRGLDADVDLTASEILDHLDVAGMLMLGARKGNWGATGDLVWVDLGAEEPLADVDPTLGILTVQALRRLGPNADLTFGARYNRLDLQIDFKSPINLELQRTKDWVDPVVGVVLRTSRERRWHATLIADIGGTGNSDLTWQFFPSIGFDMSKRTSFEVGYRVLSTDYGMGDGAGRYEYDVLYQGVAAGLAFKF